MDYIPILIALIIVAIIILLGLSKRLLFPVCFVAHAVTGIDLIHLYSVASPSLECFTSN